MRVLIVGCGYVGLPLGAELVSQGHAVVGLRRTVAAQRELEAAGIQPVSADITRLDELQKLSGPFDWVVNCVASGGGSPEDYRRVYLQGTRNLIEWLAPRPPEKFVYTSSTSVYAQNDGSTVDETSVTEPHVETAEVLLETEKVLLGATRQNDFPAVILRVAGIYGPSRGHWFKQYLRGEARMDGDGSRLLNMIHRDDVAGIIGAALKTGRAGEIYNAVDDEPVTQRDYFAWLAAQLQSALPPPSAPVDPESVRKRGTTSKRVSNRKLKRELEYQFKHPTFREGFSAEIGRLRQAGHLKPV